jgi:hypothetical protein
MSAGIGRRRTLAAAGALVALPLLSGCAEVMLISSAATMVKALPSNEPHWVETNRLTVGHAAPAVYALLEQQTEKNGRKIVERDAATLSLRVAYPFSLLKNNWGGTMRISCVADAWGTTVTVQGDGRDATTHVRAIGNEVLADLDSALRRLPRTL